MPHRRNYAHVVEVPVSTYVIRFFQAVLAGALVILTAYAIAFNDFPAVRLSIFAVCLLLLFALKSHALEGLFANLRCLGRLGCLRHWLLPRRRPRAALHLQLRRHDHHRAAYHELLCRYL